jgi:hypothetical protein
MSIIQIGDALPDATLTESTEFGEACRRGRHRRVGELPAAAG